MRRLRSALLLFALLLPSAAAAQSTADGVRALLRGDYGTAARILQSFAEGSSTPDPIAEFFMAWLYETGHGVGLSQIRACGMYLRSATPANPFMAQALVLADRIHDNRQFMRDLCVAASTQAWGTPQPVAFMFDRDHWGAIDEFGFTVGYHDLQQRATEELGGPGWVFLPARHTQFDVTVPVTTRRHFVEFFFWAPASVADRPAWALHWWIHEVKGVEVFTVDSGGVIATVEGTRPPAAFAIDDIAALRLNADGQVEWIVPGPNPRGGIIPYPVSR
jgi:hypothetical protein